MGVATEKLQEAEQQIEVLMSKGTVLQQENKMLKEQLQVRAFICIRVLVTFYYLGALFDDLQMLPAGAPSRVCTAAMCRVCLFLLAVCLREQFATAS